MAFLREAVLWVLPILFAITVHEVSHGWVAYRLGDPTAKLGGRLTLNPLKHLDPIGFILLIYVHFGWAKPVPVNPMYFRNPRRDMLLVSLAGPTSNILTAVVVAVILRLPFITLIGKIPHLLLLYLFYISVILCFFNLIPIPPLDGWNILRNILRPSPWMHQFEAYGFIIILLLVFLPMLVGINPIGVYLSAMLNIFERLLLGV
jgi:Zn-dependent protease